ncbi:hypothetical protein Tco_0439388 [Tanacetum coccineum]
MPRVWDSKYFMEQMLLAKQDEAGVILTDEQNDFIFAYASRMEEIKELSANICLMAKIQPTNIDSDAGPSYDSAFLSEVQTPSTSYVNPLFAKDNQEQKYLNQPKTINNTIGDDQIDSNIIFDEPNGDVNSSSAENDNNAQESSELEQLARNAYKEAEKQQIIAKKNPKLYDASCLDDSKIHMNVRDTEEILDDAAKIQIKMKNKMKDPIVIEKKQNLCTIDYKNLNALYEDFVPQKELSTEQKYFPSSFISSKNSSNASSSYSSSKTNSTVTPMPSANPMLVDLNQMETDFKTLFELLQTNFKREIIFYTPSEEIRGEWGYQKLFDSIKRTRTQTQGEINELIEHVNQKTYAYADVRAQNQDLLITISELKSKLKNVEKGKSMNTKFDKDNVSNKLLCVTPLNKQVFQKKTIAPKIEEKHVLSKIVTLQTSPKKQQAVETNNNLLLVLEDHRIEIHRSRIVSYPTLNSSEKVEVSDRSNNKPDVASKNVALDKKIVSNDDIKNALIVKNVLCVSCAKNVLIPCHDNCIVKYKLNVHSKVRRALFTTSRTVKSKFEDTTLVVSKTRFSVKTVQSKSLDTTLVVSKTKIVAVTPLSAKHKVSRAFNLRDNSLSKYMKNKIRTSTNCAKVKLWDTDRLERSIFAGNPGDDLLTGARESNLYIISISDMVASSPVCLMSKATLTKSWLWHHRLSRLNFRNHRTSLTKHDLVIVFRIQY